MEWSLNSNSKQNVRMKLFGWAYITFFGCTALAMFNSCNNEVASKKELQYYYFPKTNIYYDVAEANYIYSLDSGRSWQKVNNFKMNEPPLTLGGKIIISGNGEEIWKDNESHRSLYGGMLYNVITRDTSFLLADNAVKTTENKKSGYKSDSTISNPKKKRNFFQRLFGKKNK